MAQPIGGDRICMNCGQVVARDRERICNHCGLSFAPKEDPYPQLVEGSPPTIIRTYRGQQQADTTAAFQQDASELAKYGYSPTTQSWAAGQWGCGSFLVALLLFIVIVGIFVFIYMLVVKPQGTLTVTYSMERPSAGAPSVPASLTDALSQLDTARTAGLLTDDEYAAKRTELLARL